MKTDRKDESDERDFLHDLASPLSTAMFLADSVLNDIQSRAGLNLNEVVQLGGIYQALQKLNNLLHERREILNKRGTLTGEFSSGKKTKNGNGR